MSFLILIFILLPVLFCCLAKREIHNNNKIHIRAINDLDLTIENLKKQIEYLEKEVEYYKIDIDTVFRQGETEYYNEENYRPTPVKYEDSKEVEDEKDK
jgi:hypothetical protein